MFPPSCFIRTTTNHSPPPTKSKLTPGGAAFLLCPHQGWSHLQENGICHCSPAPGSSVAPSCLWIKSINSSLNRIPPNFVSLTHLKHFSVPLVQSRSLLPASHFATLVTLFILPLPPEPSLATPHLSVKRLLWVKSSVDICQVASIEVVALLSKPHKHGKSVGRPCWSAVAV